MQIKNIEHYLKTHDFFVNEHNEKLIPVKAWDEIKKRTSEIADNERDLQSQIEQKDKRIAELAEMYRVESKFNLNIKNQLKEAHEVIDFYADKGNWLRNGYDADMITEDDLELNLDSHSDNIGGKLAREYKAKWAKE